MGGFRWNKDDLRHVKTDKIPAITRGATRNPEPKELGKDIGARLHSAWCAPQVVSMGNPRKWRNLKASSRLSN